MESDDSAINNLMLGLSIASSARADADLALVQAGNANRRALNAESRASLAELEASSKTTDRDLERRLAQSRDSEEIALATVSVLRREIAQKDALITEWMHSNETLKRLAREYGKKLGLDEAERQENFGNMILRVAEENPRFQKTEFGANAKARLAGAAS